MSAEGANAAAVRRFFEAANRGDLSEGLLDNDVEVVEESGPDVGTYRGIERAREYFVEFTGHFDEYSFEIEELREDGDHVLALLHERGRGKASGVEVDQRGGWICRFRDGRCLHMRVFLDRVAVLSAWRASEGDRR
ncbi:MAG: nuclear transport factor 2 family protein [Thermoleophilaceae bacterium]